MNIHVSKLLAKMEQELQKAKMSPQDKDVREHVIVIQSLCEIILDEKTSSKLSSQSTEDFSHQELQKMMGMSSNKVSNPTSSSRVEDEDANSDSLFDF
ncbi:YwdI family protein [Metabacillus herbersteinensis]|uniref:YwdI family protein n=1 Tax=Metabacillus herbersteinensis TaxID=283816 RepID=A0ABV6GFE2_9BACI